MTMLFIRKSKYDQEDPKRKRPDTLYWLYTETRRKYGAGIIRCIILSCCKNNCPPPPPQSAAATALAGHKHTWEEKIGRLLNKTSIYWLQKILPDR